MDRRKELKEQYKQMKPEMGVFVIRSDTTKKCFLLPAKDLKSAMNRARLQLGIGSYPNKELQKAWTEQGSDAFAVEILDRLSYDKDESKSDYSEELELLADIWKDKLTAQGYDFYLK